MKNKVYYGEYSLKYWIELILKKNIILPKYQRKFVWNKSDVISLIDSIANGFFIPSVTIGFYNNENLIIDGQQRLTSLLLAYLGIYPKLESFKNENLEQSFANSNDDILENDENDYILGWTFKELLNKGNSKNEILAKIDSDYEKLLDEKEFNKININDSFFEENYLGFCYLIPQENHQKYFSSVFRNINETGTKLTSLETRRALYFLKDGMDLLFDPDCIKDVYIEKDKKQERIDFIRYLSMDFQYCKDNSTYSILKNFARKEEEYYTLFIDDFMNFKKDSIFNPYGDKFEEEISTSNLKNRIINDLKNMIEKMELKKVKFQSIIDCDIYFFGLIYFIVIKNQKINEKRIKDLKNDLDECISKIKDDKETGYLHKKTPSALKYLRPRIQKSVEIYGKYINE